MNKNNEDRLKTWAYKWWNQGLATKEKHSSIAQVLKDKNGKVF